MSADLSLDWLCGRTFELHGLAFTCVSFTDHGETWCHTADGGRWKIPLTLLTAAIRAGILVESAHAPIVHPRRRRRSARRG